MNQKTSSSLPKCVLHPDRVVSHLCLEFNCLKRFLCDHCLADHSESHKIISITKELKKFFFENHSSDSTAEKILKRLKELKCFVINIIDEWKNKILASIAQLEEYVSLNISKARECHRRLHELIAKKGFSIKADSTDHIFSCYSFLNAFETSYFVLQKNIQTYIPKLMEQAKYLPLESFQKFYSTDDAVLRRRDMKDNGYYSVSGNFCDQLSINQQTVFIFL